MYIYTIIFYLTFIISCTTFILALKECPTLYWISALSIYIYSFLGGFSIGQITVGLTFIPLTLAIASSLGWIRRNYHRALFSGLGFVIGIYAVVFIGNELFYPILMFFS